MSPLIGRLALIRVPLENGTSYDNKTGYYDTIPFVMEEIRLVKMKCHRFDNTLEEEISVFGHDQLR